MFLFLFLILIHAKTGIFALDDKNKFLWGAATAAYQIEGAVGVDGGGINIWDVFSRLPNKTHNGDTGDRADGSYYRIEEDVSLMKALGLSAYRFSIPWARILPNGSGHVNQAAITHYNTLIDALISANIKPFVTLYHWDLPQALEDDYNGWLNEKIVSDFAHFAEICFSAFGDRVKHWITLNEPLTFIVEGYGSGVFAPGRCSDRKRCAEGDSATEPYIVAHHAILAHAHAVQIYRHKFQSRQKGEIGITLNMEWGVPLTTSPEDAAAAQRWREFSLAWFADPIYFGSYPKSMEKSVGKRLPRFSDKQVALVKGSVDFFAVNHYATWYFSARKNGDTYSPGWHDDIQMSKSAYGTDGKLIGPQAASPWLHIVPSGIYNVLTWCSHRYGHPKIFITENGVDVPNESEMSQQEALNDQFRIDYYDGYLDQVGRAIAEGIDVRGYFAWSLLDNFEWADGYSCRFGLHYVDYNDDSLPRYPKASAYWYRDFAKKHAHWATEKQLLGASGSTGKVSGWRALLDNAIVEAGGAIVYGANGLAN